MRTARRFEPDRSSPRLLRRRIEDRDELWTETVGELPSVYGEGWQERDGRQFRRFEPARSKLAAGIVAGWEGPLPRPGERWLYLGAASGTTTSHVADLVGPDRAGLRRRTQPAAVRSTARDQRAVAQPSSDPRGRPRPGWVCRPRATGRWTVRRHRAAGSGRDRRTERRVTAPGRRGGAPRRAQDRQHGSGTFGGPAPGRGGGVALRGN